ncbi:cardiolipin synthase [Paenibacillus athensensis]|uniref:Cardiolipin synthase n=1 Tax=Paenibacillus athensensis TaxID=1967502 RepID=A0A4Y8Q955_9BACL|nr:cardiolipin synthase [Paenibacillus athensensis]MCD1260320.1 cardiolipin synthase [Paenibacillus athensensis]
MTWISSLFFYSFLLNIGLAVVVVFLERRNVASTWSWMMVLLFIPLLGFVLYIILGQNLSRRKLYKWHRGMLERVRSRIAAQTKLLERGELPLNGTDVLRYRDLMLLNVSTNDALVCALNDVRIHTEGKAKFDALLACIREARTHIHLQYYTVKNDELGAKIMEALIAKAKQGVEVRLLYDDIGSRSLKEAFLKRLKAYGGETAAFFPSRIPYLNYRVNYRNHRKLAIIDGTVGFIGGFNVGDEYLGKHPKLGFWRDTHLQVSGEVVRMLQARFVLDWNLAGMRPLEPGLQYFPELAQSEGRSRIPVQIVASGPNEEWPHIAYTFLKMIHAAKRTILLQTPYLIPDESLLNALKVAALSGITVKVMIPQKADHMFVHWASLYYAGELLSAGVQIYMYEKGFLHAKTLVIDGEVASVGTANFDIRSLRLNFETTALVYDQETAEELERIFAEDVKDCSELTQRDYAERSVRVRFLESISKLVSPIL